MPDSRRFEYPKFRHLVAIYLLMQVGLAIALVLYETLVSPTSEPAALSQPLLEPVFYLIVFGCASLWVAQQYRQRGIELKAIMGLPVAWAQWPAIVGLWITLFMFSMGAFQVSFALLSLAFPEYVVQLLQEPLFAGAEEAGMPWLYNLLTFGVLVVGAPILEEFLFRGFLLHRWGTRWNPAIATALSSILFGFLHPNPIGLSAFGLVMALLYLRSRSLGLVMIVHSLNNAIAAGISLLSGLQGEDQPPSLEDFRSGVWLGAIFLLVSTPFLIRFVRQNWQVTKRPLPYFDYQDE